MLIICIIFINCVSASDVEDLKDNLTVSETALPENIIIHNIHMYINTQKHIADIS